MADIPDSVVKITVEETAFQTSVSQATAQRMGGAINNILNNSTSQLGDVKQSILSVVNFQALHGATWVLMSGQSIAGSDLNALTGMANLPDAVGNQSFFRQSDVDGNLSNLQAEDVGPHTHKFVAAAVNVSILKEDGVGAAGFGAGTGTPDSRSNTEANVGETRPVNNFFNFFIKINN